MVLHALHIEHLCTGSRNENISSNHCIVCAGNRHRICISRGRCHSCIIDMCSRLHIGTIGRAIRAGSLITGCNIQNHIGFGNTRKDSIDFVITALCKACRRTQGHIYNINSQPHAVFQGSNHVIHIGAASLAIEDLHGNDLCVRCHTNNGSTVNLIRCSNTCNVSTVISQTVIVADVSSAGSVVKGKRDLTVIVQIIRRQCSTNSGGVQFFRTQIQGIQLLLQPIHAPCCANGVCSKRRMIQIQTGIQNSDGHTLTGITKILPNRCHTRHNRGRTGGGIHSIHSLSRRINSIQENTLDALRSSDRLQITKGSPNDHCIGQVGKLCNNLQVLTEQNILLNGTDQLILLCS